MMNKYIDCLPHLINNAYLLILINCINGSQHYLTRLPGCKSRKNSGLISLFMKITIPGTHCIKKISIRPPLQITNVNQVENRELQQQFGKRQMEKNSSTKPQICVYSKFSKLEKIEI
jgi:hypothetical protein